MSQSLEEVAQSYIRSHVRISRPYRGLNLMVGLTDFIQAMRQEGFVNESEAELIEAFQAAQRQVDEFYQNYF